MRRTCGPAPLALAGHCDRYDYNDCRGNYADGLIRAAQSRPLSVFPATALNASAGARLPKATRNPLTLFSCLFQVGALVSHI